MAAGDEAWLWGGGVERFLFVAPHYDDVAFSCGGTVARLARAGAPVTIAVVCAAVPPAGARLTPFAKRHHALWGLGADAAASNAGRLAEEQASAALLGAAVVTLPFPDAIYRSARYRGNEQLFGPLVPDERMLPDTIANALQEAVGPLTRTRCFVPLGVGRHVDHQLAFLAGQALTTEALDAWCYTDLPYSLRADLLDTRLAELAIDSAAPHTVAIEAVWETRVAAVLSYHSQIASAFGYVGIDPAPAAITHALDRFAGGAGKRCDRFWSRRLPTRP